MATTATITPNQGSAPVTLQAGNYSAVDDRRFWGAGVREGVVNGGSYRVIQRAAGANMTVDVASSVGSGAIVQGDSITAQGNYFVPPTTADVNVDIATSDATNPRNDLVVLEIKDDQHDASGLNLARVRVITGTPNGSAAATDAPGANGTPALPSSCLLLAVVRVTAGATSVTTAMINDRRPWSGGVPERVTSLPSPAVDGQEVYFQSTTAGSGGGSSDTMSGIGITWHLRYRNTFNGGNATYPWEFVGGGSISNEIETNQPTTGTHTTFQDLATVGPQVIVPLAGWYRFTFSGNLEFTAGATAALVALKIGSAAVTSERLAQNNQASVVMGGGSLFREVATAGGLTCKVQYASAANVASSYAQRRLVVQPVRVG
jgi:hypothetical protein